MPQQNLFFQKPKSPFKLSRSKIELFVECPRCFYLDVKLGIRRPSWPAFTLNSAVDHLLKKEFDIHRAKNSTHPLLKNYGLEAVPFQHQELENWRNFRQGIQYQDPKTNFLVYGAIDDIWISKKEELIVVDYKATSINGEVTLDGEWKEGYKRQLEIYQWLFRKNGFKVSDTGYFVYVNAKRDRKAFDGKLEFDVKLLPYKGSTSWIEPTLKEIKKILQTDKLPKAKSTCEYCQYRQKAEKIERD